jgi:type II secretory pathway pseudopilin PulG
MKRSTRRIRDIGVERIRCRTTPIGGSSESGDTLIEVLVALAVIGLTAAALLGSFTTSIMASSEHRQLVTIDAELKSFAEAATYQIQMQPVVASPSSTPLFASCAAVSTYSLAVPFPPSASAGSVVTIFGSGFTTGATVSVTVGGTAIAAGNFVSGRTVLAAGYVAASVTLPVSGLTTGTNTLVVSDGSHRATTAFTVTPGTPVVLASLTGGTLAVSAIQYWNKTTSAFAATCVAGSTTPQLITVTATGPGNVTDTLDFVVADPAYSP